MVNVHTENGCFFPHRSKSEVTKDESVKIENEINWSSFADLYSVALVYFNLTKPDFLEFTPWEFNRLLEIKGLENDRFYRQDMERMRTQTFALLVPKLGKNSTIKEPEDLMKFNWDIDKNVNDSKLEMTEEDWEKLDRNFPASKIK